MELLFNCIIYVYYVFIVDQLKYPRHPVPFFFVIVIQSNYYATQLPRRQLHSSFCSLEFILFSTLLL